MTFEYERDGGERGGEGKGKCEVEWHTRDSVGFISTGQNGEEGWGWGASPLVKPSAHTQPGPVKAIKGIHSGKWSPSHGDAHEAEFREGVFSVASHLFAVASSFLGLLWDG